MTSLLLDIDRLASELEQLTAAAACSVFVVLSTPGTAVQVHGAEVTPADPDTVARTVRLRSQLEQLVTLRDQWARELHYGGAFVSLADAERDLKAGALVGGLA